MQAPPGPASGPPAATPLRGRADADLALKSSYQPTCLDCLPWTSHRFFAAAAQGDFETISRMLSDDITLIKKVVGRRRLSAWHIAAENGRVDVLATLVAAVLNCDDAYHQLNSSLRRLFHVAEVGEKLVQQFVNWRAWGGVTPMHLAARKGQAAAVDYLISIGGNPWIHDLDGLCPLHMAAIYNRCEVIHELCKHPMPYSDKACAPNHSGTKYVDVLDPFGWAPLHHAALNNRLEAVKTLVSHDANLIARTRLHNMRVELLPSGLSALHLAAYRGNLAMAKTILRAYYEDTADLLPSQLGTVERRRRQRSHPDPRLVLTRTARLAYHFAHRMQHRDMLEWLDPSIPLMFLFGGTDDDGNHAGPNGAVLVGPPRLAVIAATVLHTMLEQSLQQAHVAVQAHANKRADMDKEQQGAAEKKGLLSTLNRLRQAASRSQPTTPALRSSSNGAPAAASTGLEQVSAGSSPGPSPRVDSLNATTGRRSMTVMQQEATSAEAVGTQNLAATSVRGKVRSAKSAVQGSQALHRAATEAAAAAAQAQQATSSHQHDLPGSRASFMQRLRQGVRLGRSKQPEPAPPAQQDLLRMGITIPNNVESDPQAVAVLHRQSPAVRTHSLQPFGLQQLSVTTRAHRQVSVDSTAAGTVRGASDSGWEGSRASSGTQQQRRQGSTSEPGGGMRCVRMMGTRFLTDDPPSPLSEESHLPGRSPFDTAASQADPTTQLLPGAATPEPEEHDDGAPVGLPADAAAGLSLEDWHLAAEQQQPRQQQQLQPHCVPRNGLHRRTLSRMAGGYAAAEGGQGVHPVDGEDARVSMGGESGPGRRGSRSENGIMDSMRRQMQRVISHQVHPLPSNSGQLDATVDSTGDSAADMEGVGNVRNIQDSVHSQHHEAWGTDAGASTVATEHDQEGDQEGPNAEPKLDKHKLGNGAAGGEGLVKGVGMQQAEEEDLDDDVCPICLYEAPNIRLKTCDHRLCVSCAQDLCKRHVLTPARCPYCRVIISSFQPLLL